jgi:glycerate-2-kinase
MKIQNARELAITPTREIMIRIAESAFESIDTKKAIAKTCKKEGNVCSILGEEISQKGRFFICGAGKCSLEAGQELERIFRGNITDGFLIGTEPGTLNFITYQEGTHPFPSEKNKEATRALKEKISSLRLQEQDTVLCLISGGGSVLLSDGEVISIEKEEAMMKRLFEVGADITSMNTMRKHISSVRGGFLAKLLYPHL